MAKLIGVGTQGCVFTNGQFAYKVSSIKRDILDELETCTYVSSRLTQAQRRHLILLTNMKRYETSGEVDDLINRVRWRYECLMNTPDLYLAKMPLKSMDLHTFIKDHDYSKHDANQIMWGILHGCTALHLSKVVHFDLSPNNILLDIKPSHIRSYITDLGHALKLNSRDWGEAEQAQVTWLAVTACVRPPELMGTELGVDGEYTVNYTYTPKSRLKVVDSWSVGVLCDMLFQKLNGKNLKDSWLQKSFNLDSLKICLHEARVFVRDELSPNDMANIIIDSLLQESPDHRPPICAIYQRIKKLRTSLKAPSTKDTRVVTLNG